MNLIEFKAQLSVDDAGMISGLAWPFGSPDRVGDIIEPGAFKNATVPLPMLFSHDVKNPVGVWNSLEETKRGLEVKGPLLIDDLQKAREARALVKSGALTGLSIGFITKSAVNRKDGGRTIKALELVEISLVTVPCHPGARISQAKSNAFALAEIFNRATAQIKRT